MGIFLTKSNTFLIGPISRLLGAIMNGIFEFVCWIGIENAAIGISIILFTIIVYTLLLPMTIKQQKSTRLMSIMNPEIQAIQKKYKDKKDQASMMKMQDEMNMVYQKYGTSPTGGCLGTLIQFPILFALWPVVQNIPAYVGRVFKVYTPLVEKIIATKGSQKVIEEFAKGKAVKIGDKLTNEKVVDVLYKFQEADWVSLSKKFPKLTDLIESTKENISAFNNFIGINMAETPISMITNNFNSFKDFWNTLEFEFVDGKFFESIKEFFVCIGKLLAYGWNEKIIIMIIVAIFIPVLAGVTQLINSKIIQKGNNTNQNSDNAVASQMNMMMKIMPVFSTLMCFSMPSGLGIYWITSAVVRTIQQVCINKHLDKKPIDEMIKENLEKAAKKNRKKDAVEASILNQRAQTSTRNIDRPQRQTTSNNSFDSYKENAKPGSLASKANMVRDFNNRNKKEK